MPFPASPRRSSAVFSPAGIFDSGEIDWGEYFGQKEEDGPVDSPDETAMFGSRREISVSRPVER